MIKAFIFDLDGVIVDTAKYHYLAWKELAGRLGFLFSEAQNERLKGVSRMKSLDILLSIGGTKASQEEKERMAAEKNERYKEYISRMTPEDVLPCVKEFLYSARSMGMKTGLGSASKNTHLILERIGVTDLFDVIVDGNMVSHAKPDPEIFLKGAELLNVHPSHCIVFEDAVAGVEAAHRAGMTCIGMGDAKILDDADAVIYDFCQLKVEKGRLKIIGAEDFKSIDLFNI